MARICHFFLCQCKYHTDLENTEVLMLVCHPVLVSFCLFVF